MDNPSYDVAFVIDRMRLCELLQGVEVVAIPELDSILEWTRKKREELKVDYQVAA